jgi:EAL domain-containing protein (putative c-di-GMP-specific phosphodiesterase class I)
MHLADAIFIPLALIAFFLLVVPDFRYTWRQRASEDWPTTEATIDGATLRFGGPQLAAILFIYRVLFTYSYPVHGVQYTGLFVLIADKKKLGEGLKQARAWVDAGLPLGTMAVNISAMEFRDENFLEGVFAILKDMGLDPRSPELELTESVLRGVQLAVDDFGTGYSSLSYLRKFPIDALKIDQSFVRQITTAPDETTIVTAVISMGRSLKLRVVAEGVETREEMVFLQAHQCDEAQGYYFSRPVVAQQFAQLLQMGIAEAILH